MLLRRKIAGIIPESAGFVAVAAGGNLAAYSANAVEWTSVTLPTAINWYNVAYGGGRFVATALDSAVTAYSSGGTKWAQGADIPVLGARRALAFGDGKFVTLSAEGSAHSADGKSWTQGGASGKAWTGLTYGPGIYGNKKFVAVANSSNTSGHSTDGVSWTTFNLPRTGYWYGVANGGGGFVAINYSGYIAYSTNGTAWTEVAALSVSLSKVAYGAGRFVVLPYSGNIAVCSEDGQVWEEITLPVSEIWHCMTFGNGKFVAAGGNSGTVIYSENGINWEETAMPAATAWTAVCGRN
jgi:hypothetical protein